MREIAPQETRQIDVVDAKIGFCRGCFACKTNGGICVMEDDMRGILASIPESDVLLMRFPLYRHGMPAMPKNLIERMMPLSSTAMTRADGHYIHAGRQDLSHLKCLMLCGCGFPNSKRF